LLVQGFKVFNGSRVHLVQIVQVVQALIAAGVLMALCACSYGNPPVQVVAGRPFSLAEARAIRLGDTLEHVRSMLGAPLSVSKDARGETWVYAVQTHRQENIKLLGLIPWPAKERGSELSAAFRFENDVLINKVLDPER
jgi:outer membrane protein assembly factor BamE (lipoprotein component of BamABCDE complex)